MEVGNVISQKIRSAIKAKLVDLGAYVDDELPDYIMVMVANKKNKEQMTEDLNLFLGNNTEKFTAWLHALLEKLQSITADAPKDESQQQQLVGNPGNQGNPEPTATISVRSAPPAAEEDVEPVLKLQAGDDFDDEVVESKQSKPAVRGKEIKSVLKSRPEPTKRSSSSSDDKHRHKARKATKSVSFESTPDPPTGRTGPSSSSSSRAPRRRGPVSAVGAVLKHDVEDNDEYDPLRPAIGNVASVVRAPPRRSSVPTKLQANKSLLLRAVSDAQTSIEAAEKKSSGKRDRDRKSVKDRVGRRQKPSVQSRLGGRRHDTDSDVKERLTLTSRSRREDKRKADIIRRSPSPDEGDSKVNRSPSPKREEAVLDICIPDDQRLIHCSDSEEEETLGNGIHGDRNHSNQADRRIVDELVESGAELSEYEDGEGETEAGSLNPSEAPQSPKFVVTLDGVDPHMLKQERYQQGGSQEGSQVDARQARGVKRSHTQDEFFTEESFGEDYDDDESPKKAKLPEKCRFWPGCKNGDDCPYHHPSTNCTNFPRCKFGDKCLYIHPPCKFDVSCTRPGCAFTHSSRRPPASIPQAPTVIVQPIKVPVYPVSKPSFSKERPKAPLHPRQITCRFFPQCTNMNCPYNHPKPCRYGVSCNQKNACPYSHPDLPSKNQLSWSKQSTSLSPIESLS